MTKLTVVTIQPGALYGTVEEVDWDYKWIKDFVGGWIEHVTLDGRQIGLYMNEEAKLLDPPLPVNGVATALYRRSRGYHGDTPVPAGMTIEGPVVLVGGPNDEGDDISLTPFTLGLLRDLGVIK